MIFELKSPCVLASCANAERENFQCVAYFPICILRPFKRLADLCERVRVCKLWVTQESTSVLLWVTEDWSPVGTIWIRKNPTSDLVMICFSVAFTLMAQLISVLLIGSEWKKKIWMYLIYQMRRSLASPGTQTIPHSHPPKLPVHQVCFWLCLSKDSGQRLLSHPWQVSMKQNGQKRDMSDSREGRHAYKRCDTR